MYIYIYIYIYMHILFCINTQIYTLKGVWTIGLRIIAQEVNCSLEIAPDEKCLSDDLSPT